ncbi:MAG: antibiotic biosynthesis monooxygenase [Chloroflexi bacterium]|nr:antibiotic biosynthesis monooxygenase [Chloroflexota bacterium]
MYGTIARMRAKPGMEQQLITVASETESVPVPGVIAVYVYQMDSDPREFMLAVIFESKEAYFANAESPDQHQRFLQLMTCLEAEPEWHDGHIVFAGPS